MREGLPDLSKLKAAITLVSRAFEIPLKLERGHIFKSAIINIAQCCSALGCIAESFPRRLNTPRHSSVLSRVLRSIKQYWAHLVALTQYWAVLSDADQCWSRVLNDIVNTIHQRSARLRTKQYWAMLVSTELYFTVPSSSAQCWALMTSAHCWAVLLSTEQYCSVLLSTAQTWSILLSTARCCSQPVNTSQSRSVVLLTA